MGRVLRYDGLLPMVFDAEGKPAQASPDDIRAMRAYVEANRPAENQGRLFDIVVEGVTPGDDAQAAAAQVRPWVQAGATWWIEAMWSANEREDGLEFLKKRVLQGPPVV
jgi:hypothetical protein